ncbi:MAG: hypothetical protein Q7T34_01520 [Candidatus Parcubacteria bacterium]|nr:hypothetical protein [Candidatus Parcubacteria bacterium]
MIKTIVLIKCFIPQDVQAVKDKLPKSWEIYEINPSIPPFSFLFSFAVMIKTKSHEELEDKINHIKSMDGVENISIFAVVSTNLPPWFYVNFYCKN